ncbi:hypothetical protein [Deinococcus altitudinis]|uniref:hypothetical protein n=1 Tax=Deinococcus altitudinis TaxID=468914 RepID=UPI0038928843
MKASASPIGGVRVKGNASGVTPTSFRDVLKWRMADQKLKDHFETADGSSTLHLLSHDPATDTVTYEERIRTPEAAKMSHIAMEPKSTTAQLWIGMTGGAAE